MTFAHAVKAVLPHVPKSEVTQELISVLLRDTPTGPEAIGCDLYTLGISTFDTAITGLCTRGVLINAADAKEIVRLKFTSESNSIDIDVDEQALKAVHDDGEFTCDIVTDHRYPPIDRLFNDLTPRQEIGHVALRAQNLERLAPRHLARTSEERKLPVDFMIAEGGHKPVSWTFSNHSRGLIMPVFKN